MKEETEKRISSVLKNHPGLFLSPQEIAKAANVHYYAVIVYVQTNARTLRKIKSGSGRMLYQLKTGSKE